jgi:hypothetical protein
MAETNGISGRPESVTIPRAQGRSECPIELDEQLDVGLEDTFPARGRHSEENRP